PFFVVDHCRQSDLHPIKWAGQAHAIGRRLEGPLRIFNGGWASLAPPRHDLVEAYSASQRKPLFAPAMLAAGGAPPITRAGQLAREWILEKGVGPFTLPGTVDSNPEGGIGNVAD